MRRWQKRALGVVTLGGAATGFLMTVTSLSSAKNALTLSVGLVFATIFAWGVWCGMHILEGDENAENAAMWYWSIQVPSIESPMITYSLSSGLYGGAKLKFIPSISIWVDGAIGSSFRFWLGQAGAPWVIGMNLAAAAIVAWLFYRQQHVLVHAGTPAPRSTQENPESAEAVPATPAGEGAANSSS